MMTATGVETSTCSTEWLRGSLAQAESLLPLAEKEGGEWTALLATDIAAYRAELVKRFKAATPARKNAMDKLVESLRTSSNPRERQIYADAVKKCDRINTVGLSAKQLLEVRALRSAAPVTVGN